VPRQHPASFLGCSAERTKNARTQWLYLTRTPFSSRNSNKAPIQLLCLFTHLTVITENTHIYLCVSVNAVRHPSWVRIPKRTRNRESTTSAKSDMCFVVINHYICNCIEHGKVSICKQGTTCHKAPPTERHFYMRFWCKSCQRIADDIKTIRRSTAHNIRTTR
jgi:hypothetical protein